MNHLDNIIFGQFLTHPYNTWVYIDKDLQVYVFVNVDLLLEFR